MWKCPKCETLNEFQYCSLCGEEKPIQKPQRNMSSVNDKVIRSLIAIISLLVVLTVIFICIMPVAKDFIAFKQQNTAEATESAAETISPSPSDSPTSPPASLPREITGVYSGGTKGSVDEIIIETSQYVVPKLSTLSDNPRVVIDFYDFTLRDETYSTQISGYNYSNIRKANHDSYARVVIDITRNCYINLESTDNRCVVTLSPK